MYSLWATRYMGCKKRAFALLAGSFMPYYFIMKAEIVIVFQPLRPTLSLVAALRAATFDTIQIVLFQRGFKKLT